MRSGHKSKFTVRLQKILVTGIQSSTITWDTPFLETSSISHEHVLRLPYLLLLIVDTHFGNICINFWTVWWSQSDDFGRLRQNWRIPCRSMPQATSYHLPLPPENVRTCRLYTQGHNTPFCQFVLMVWAGGHEIWIRRRQGGKAFTFPHLYQPLLFPLLLQSH